MRRHTYIRVRGVCVRVCVCEGVCVCELIV